jgi:molecular chaperone GrpE
MSIANLNDEEKKQSLNAPSEDHDEQDRSLEPDKEKNKKDTMETSENEEKLKTEEQEFDNIDEILEEYAKEGINQEIVIETEEEIVEEHDKIIEKLQAEIESMKKQVADYYSRYLRLKSEFDEYKKRVRKEKTDIINYSNETLILELLPILDNMERAIEAAKKSNIDDGLVNGLELIHKQKTHLLEKFGITVIPAVGEIFDPRVHEAFVRMDVAEDQDKRVLSEFQRGYILHEKVIRPARVAVGFNPKRQQLTPIDTQDSDDQNNTTKTQPEELPNSEGI